MGAMEGLELAGSAHERGGEKLDLELRLGLIKDGSMMAPAAAAHERGDEKLDLELRLGLTKVDSKDDKSTAAPGVVSWVGPFRNPRRPAPSFTPYHCTMANPIANPLNGRRSSGMAARLPELPVMPQSINGVGSHSHQLRNLMAPLPPPPTVVADSTIYGRYPWFSNYLAPAPGNSSRRIEMPYRRQYLPEKVGIEPASNNVQGGKSATKRRCLNPRCNTTETPMWRWGPLGPRTLCNACGLRYTRTERRQNSERVAAATTVRAGISSVVNQWVPLHYPI